MTNTHNESNPNLERENVLTTRMLLDGDFDLADLDRLLQVKIPDIKLSTFLKKRLEECELNADDLAEEARIGRSTVYSTLNGNMKPTQDALLRMAFVLQLTPEETQYMLKLGRRATLSSTTEPRDRVIIVGLNCSLTLAEMDNILMERNFDPLTPVEKTLSSCLEPFMKEMSFVQLLKKSYLYTRDMLTMLQKVSHGDTLRGLDEIADALEQHDLLRIGFVLGMNANQVQRLLRTCGRGYLHSAEKPRDKMIHDGLNQSLSLEEMNALLKENGMTPLIPED